jgi:hypothetical protein
MVLKRRLLVVIVLVDITPPAEDLAVYLARRQAVTQLFRLLCRTVSLITELITRYPGLRDLCTGNQQQGRRNERDSFQVFHGCLPFYLHQGETLFQRLGAVPSLQQRVLVSLIHSGFIHSDIGGFVAPGQR